jgi:hypothetical protein
MAMTKKFLSHRSHIVALGMLLLVSLLLTQVPLFNYLGYEFSAVIVIGWSLIAGLLTISLWNKREPQTEESFAAFIRRSLSNVLAALCIPLIVIVVNALFVKNCSLVQGVILFVLVTVFGIAAAHAISVFCIALFPRSKKTGFVIAWLLVLSQIAWVGLTGPQIFAFNPILGFFPGLTYDETLDITGRLLIYRGGTVILIAFLYLVSSVIDFRRRNRGSPLSQSASRRVRAVIAVLGVLLILLFFISDRIGLSSSESSIEDTLGGRRETEHFIVYYPDTLLKGARLEQVIQLHEFYYAEVARTLWIRSERKIQSFIYGSPSQKGRLMGAANTDIAKPWLSQLHINADDVDASLRHELVHVMAADFGFPVLRIGVNSGLIEGLATAVEHQAYEEPIHRLAAMAYASGSTPDMQSLFSLSGFMKAPAGVSYTLAGSFCRYLIDRYGMRRFKLLYRTGEYSIIYEKSLPLLLQEWRRSLDRFRLSDGDIAKAGYLFKRQSIFGKVCARVIAGMNAETRSRLNARHYEEALASAELSLDRATSIEAVYQKTTALVRLGKYTEAIVFAQEQLADSAAATSFLTLKSLLGDALWGADSLEHAGQMYGDLLQCHLSLAWDESVALRQELVRKPALAGALKVLFLSALEDSSRSALLQIVASQFPKEPLVAYLFSREMAVKGRSDEALRSLERMSPFDSQVLELARQRRLAQLALSLGRYQISKVYLWQSLNHVYRDVQSIEAEEKLRFCDWMSEIDRRSH